ncbi:hypothetical protein HYDPIDRAFT_33509 [Hydnomerulius pinastri MD-312]|uniref:Uncharacterized protein n=1 Tax=Hydnomerulius pinastri MD-312 TaxID=994086 RepID=A0A0C9W8S0_9AGAM|nr:hypothetical protein HYDPIDRAFT_33509 [Hydnomerulius pinastri MD-312]
MAVIFAPAHRLDLRVGGKYRLGKKIDPAVDASRREKDLQIVSHLKNPFGVATTYPPSRNLIHHNIKPTNVALPHAALSISTSPPESPVLLPYSLVPLLCSLSTTPLPPRLSCYESSGLCPSAC